MTIAIVDYGMGNLYSVKKILDSLGASNIITNKAAEIINADKIILPGVGAFHAAMQNLHALNLVAPLTEAVIHHKKPFLGICLGMQLMAKSSDEGKHAQGLGWIDASVEEFSIEKSYRVPHMGWNSVKLLRPSPLFTDFAGEPTFYFTHSFIMNNKNREDIIATCQYGTTFSAAIQTNNLFGTQFHPEKSQTYGKILVENFLNWKGE